MIPPLLNTCPCCEPASLGTIAASLGFGLLLVLIGLLIMPPVMKLLERYFDWWDD